MRKQLLYAPRVRGDIDLGLEPSRIDIGGDKRWARINTPGGLLPGYTEQDTYVDSLTQKYRVGTKRVEDDREYRYSHLYTGVGQGTSGRPMLSYNTAATEKGAHLLAQTEGLYTVDWTVQAAVSMAAGQFAEGYVLLQGGFMRRIKWNTYALNGAATTLTLYDPIPETVATGRSGILMEAKWANVYRRGLMGAIPGLCVGVTTFDVTDEYWFWAQVKGPCALISGENDKGDADAEAVWVCNANPGDEVKIMAANGYQVIGHTLPMNVTDWDGENFVAVDLCIE